MSVLRLTPGTVFAGDYQIVSPLAEGGMGSVYVARQLSTGKDRALKIMQPNLATDDRSRERFTREARAGSQVDSEHVVEVVGAGIDAETRIPWMAMELLRGEDLATFAHRVGPLGPGQVLDIFRQLCHALGAAHAGGLVHRDLKPENIFLATSRRVGVPYTVKLLDFGIAKVVQETKHQITEAVGTPTWMAPEQTEAGATITPAADVWALGLIAFRLLTGREYWKAANDGDSSAMAVLREVCFEPLEPASIRARAYDSPVILPPSFDAWFSRCLDRDPSKRYPHAAAALTALEPALASVRRSDAPEPAEPIAATERVPALMSTTPATQPAPIVDRASDALRAAPAAAGTESGVSAPDEVDAYEKRLSGGRRWVWLGALGLIALVSFTAWHFSQSDATGAPVFHGREQEPNNRAGEANPLPLGERIEGQIGQRLDAERSDRDFYAVDVPPGTSLVTVHFEALPNIAPCVFVYLPGADEPMGRYCAGRPGQDLKIDALRVDPGKLLFAVLQDREQYTERPPPPVLENVSDDYALSVVPAEPTPETEQEPNDAADSAQSVPVGRAVYATLGWMRDVDVFCAPGSDEPIRFTLRESDSPRPRGAVLEVTPLAGKSHGIPVRVHQENARGEPNERDVESPWTSDPIGPDATAQRCISVTLVPDVWSDPPLPRVAQASGATYRVAVEPTAGAHAE